MNKEDILKEFEDSLILCNLAKTTIANYLYIIRKFIKTTGVAPQKLSTQHFTLYAYENPDKLPVLRKFHLFLQQKKGWINEPFLLRLPMQQKTREVDEKDYNYIISNLEKIKNIKTRVLIIMLLCTLRINDAFNVKAGNINSMGTIELSKKHSKNERGRTPTVPPELLNILLEYIRKNRLSPKDLMLSSKGQKLSYYKARKLFDEGMAELGLTKYTPHHLRHLSITHRQKNLSLGAAMDETGHSNPGQIVGYISMGADTAREKLSLHPYFNFSKERGNSDAQ